MIWLKEYFGKASEPKLVILTVELNYLANLYYEKCLGSFCFLSLFLFYKLSKEG